MKDSQTTELDSCKVIRLDGVEVRLDYWACRYRVDALHMAHARFGYLPVLWAQG